MNMQTIKFCFIASAMIAMHSTVALSEDVDWYDGTNAVSYCVQKKTDPVVCTALKMFSSDMLAVTGKAAVAANNERAKIIIIELDQASKVEKRLLKYAGVPTEELSKKIDGFYISVNDGKIMVVGANGRGTAYGILELSRMAGVNPWIWWGDVKPVKRNRLSIDDSFKTMQGASVQYRGIFINDEDWSIRPWSYKTFEPGPENQIGPNTYKKVFQLLMRLRGNAIWPAMHEKTTSFFKLKGAKAVADSCGIAIGSSHCEPLLRSNTGEWNVKERGRYNYITNRKAVQEYWVERLREVKGSKGGNLFTIGMRGIHDGSMEGVNTMQEKFDALQQVINDQQELIRKYIGDPSKQTQVIIPYKEVLQIYERGLKVPDYVTLMWCDDNYGYMTRLSNKSEQKRSGGGGIYYHLSYWGQPHDHLWLTTTQPGLIYNEMRAAYDHNVRKIWIVNVHDPKVAGYDLELFLDMAWNINCVSPSTINDHYHAWLCRQFGKEAGDKLFPAMHEFYRLCGERRPEFMGWSQVERLDGLYISDHSPVRDTEFSTSAFGNELERYIERFADVSETVEETEKSIRPELKDAYFTAIKYPVLAAAAHARKLLYAQVAREQASSIDMTTPYLAMAKSQSAYQEIRTLTEYYNTKVANGKWNRLMDMRPRNLPVFCSPTLPELLTSEEAMAWLAKDSSVKRHPLDNDGTIACNASEYKTATAGAQAIQMLGHSMGAVRLPINGTLTYEFTTLKDSDAVLRLALIPTQPNDNGDLRFSVSVDGAVPTVFSLKEPFRSERWKLNVLRGQAIRTMKLNGIKAGNHRLEIQALDDHVVVDQWMVDYNKNRRFYLFPVASD